MIAVDLVAPVKSGDIITHQTMWGTYTYTVNKVNEEGRPINLHVSYEGKEENSK